MPVGEAQRQRRRPCRSNRVHRHRSAGDPGRRKGLVNLCQIAQKSEQHPLPCPRLRNYCPFTNLGNQYERTSKAGLP